MDPLELDWGTVTPELVSEDSSYAVHVINHAIGSNAQLERNLAFIRGRVAVFTRVLPPEMGQQIIFDDRGQDIPHDIRQALRAALSELGPFNFFSERE